jgi:hypothetical protein
MVVAALAVIIWSAGLHVGDTPIPGYAPLTARIERLQSSRIGSTSVAANNG